MQKNKIIVGFSCVSVIIISCCFFEEQSAVATTIQIPNPIKSKIALWADNQTSDQDFLSSLAELDRLGIIKKHSIIKNQNTYHLPKYGETIFVKIVGRTGDYGQTNPVFLTILDPNGKRTQYNVPVLESSAYSTIIPITHDSPVGTYTIFASHVGKELPTSYFYLKSDSQIPWWIKNTAKWLTHGIISDSDFVLSMQYLIDKKVITIDDVTGGNQESILNVSVNGYKAVRRGTAQSLDVHVSDLNGPVAGATVSVRVEDYGENILKEFSGITGDSGDYKISWELSKDFDNIETFLVFVDVTDGISSKTSMFSFQVYCLCGEPNCKCHN